MTERQDIELLKKIQAIVTINEEIIQRVKAKQSVVTSCNFTVVQGQFTVEVKETKESQNAQDLIKLWQAKVELTPVEDIFNDKIEYTCTTIDDVGNLNGQILRVAQKFKRFGGSSEAVEDLIKFKENVEKIQVCLGELEEKLMDVDSKLGELNQSAEKINKKIARLQELAGKSSISCDKWKDLLRKPTEPVQPVQPVRGTIVSKVDVGARVRRGRDWHWGTQDGGTSGSILSLSSPGWVKVKWDSGDTNSYEIGAENLYSLYYD